MGFVLFIVALIFTTALTILWLPVSVFYHLITFRFRTGLKNINKYFLMLAIIIDIFGCESLQTPLNYLMIKRKFRDVARKYGDDDRNTISYITGQNYYLGYLSNFGLFWAKLLNNLETDHLKIAIELKIIRDRKSKERIKFNERIINTINKK